MGNLTRDPELRYTQSNVAICKFGLAVNRRFKDQSGEWRDEATFVDITVFGKRGEAFAKFHTKGKPAFIEGTLRFDTWEDKDGGKRSKLYVVADSWEFVGGGQGGGQGVGGGFGGGQGGGGFGGGQGGGFGGGGQGAGGIFNIPPGREGKLKIKTFCLEHGKHDPAARMEYTVKPLSVLTKDPAIEQMCRMLANDEIAQPVAQAAAWNVANKLSWNFMLTKNRVELSNGYFERYFTPAHLVYAQRTVVEAQKRAEYFAKLQKESGQQSTKELFATEKKDGE